MTINGSWKENHKEKILTPQNQMSYYLKILSIIILIIGFFVGIIAYDGFYAFPIWISIFFGFIAIQIIAEILQILHDIRFKLWEQNKKESQKK